MLAAEVDSADLAKLTVAEMLKRRIVINCTSDTVLRFLPPYILEQEHVDTAIAALDEIFTEHLDPRFNKDAVESKLFGIGSESYVVGSHEFYLGYAIRNRKMLCLDAGHFHPTEVISDKISAVLCWLDEILLHMSRGVRWDSDHVVTLTDELEAIAREVVRGGFLGRVHLGLDFFDASINRVAAWVIGTRALLKALLLALLEPRDMLRRLEAVGDFTARLTMGGSPAAFCVIVPWRDRGRGAPSAG